MDDYANMYIKGFNAVRSPFYTFIWPEIRSIYYIIT
jgi:hypothetical protein